MDKCRVLALSCALVVFAVGANGNDAFGTGLRVLRRVYDNCEKSEEIVKCFKIQAAKLADRAARMESLKIMDGVSLVKREESTGRAVSSSLPEGDLNRLSTDEIDVALENAASKLLDSHKLSVSPTAVGADVGRSMDEARGKLKKYIGPIITAIAIKGGFVAMAFQAIALIAGKALLIGKIALVLSAIIGLKKLVSGGEAHEKTTYEIVKHPQVSQSHTYSSSHYGGGGDFEASGPGGHYRRSVEEEAMAAQDRAYRAYAQAQH